jgi:hypothetical protein
VEPWNWTAMQAKPVSQQAMEASRKKTETTR